MVYFDVLDFCLYKICLYIRFVYLYIAGSVGYFFLVYGLEYITPVLNAEIYVAVVNCELYIGKN